tara:strand:- start:2122 stop:2505 length:384 start_codon:yes stop_codon:yes gene_type:complete
MQEYIDNNNNKCIAVKSSYFGNHFLSSYITKNSYLRQLFATTKSKNNHHIYCHATTYGYGTTGDSRIVLVPLDNIDIIYYMLNADLEKYDVWNNQYTSSDERKSGKIVVKRILKDIRKYKRLSNANK